MRLSKNWDSLGNWIRVAVKAALCTNFGDFDFGASAKIRPLIINHFFTITRLHCDFFVNNTVFRLIICHHWFKIAIKRKKYKKTLCVVTIALICPNLASLWKFQNFRRSIYNPVEHLWWSFYSKNSKSLNIFTKKLHHRCLLGF